MQLQCTSQNSWLYHCLGYASQLGTNWRDTINSDPGTRRPGTRTRGPGDSRIFSCYGRQKCNYKPKLMVISLPGVCKSNRKTFLACSIILWLRFSTSEYCLIFMYLVLRQSQTLAHYSKLQKSIWPLSCIYSTALRNYCTPGRGKIVPRNLNK